ncbi:MAG: magnesium/cobalt transporter CorA [Archangium sp.]
MLRVRVYDQGQLLDGDEALLSGPGLKWIDVAEPDEPTLMRLGERFGLHKLAIEDCLHLDQRPKLEDYGTHQFIVLQGFSSENDAWADLEMHELHFFLGADWLITVHDKTGKAFEGVHKRLELDAAGTIGRGVDFLAYLIADALVDRHFPLLDCFTDEIEQLEEKIFQSKPHPKLLQEIFELKRALVLVRRVLSPQRDVVGLLSRRGIPQVQEKTTIYFRDIYDHLVRIYEQLESARDLVSSNVDAYMSQLANRTNDITKQLTIFAAIFLPLSFIVGFFGQNFEVLGRPEFFAVMLALMVLLPIGMIAWFRHKEWL